MSTLMGEFSPSAPTIYFWSEWFFFILQSCLSVHKKTSLAESTQPAHRPGATSDQLDFLLGRPSMFHGWWLALPPGPRAPETRGPTCHGSSQGTFLNTSMDHPSLSLWGGVWSTALSDAITQEQNVHSYVTPLFHMWAPWYTHQLSSPDQWNMIPFLFRDTLNGCALENESAKGIKPIICLLYVLQVHRYKVLDSFT